MEIGKRRRRRPALFWCMECGRGFSSVQAAERAAFNGCPKCNGLDIDLAEVKIVLKHETYEVAGVRKIEFPEDL